MKRTFLVLPIASIFCLALVMFGCKADVDLGNIDTTTSVKANLALPIGTVSATIGNFVGDGTWGIYVDSLDNKGVLTFKDTFSWKRDFHKIDITQHISEKSLTMNVYEKLIDGKVTGNDNIIIPLEFPMTLHLNGINHDEDYQRLDSILIKNASFTSRIDRHNLPLDWEWVEKVTIKLGKEFHRQKGNVVTVYTKGEEGDYGKDLPINVDEFSINLMKNTDPQGWEDYRGNVLDSCELLVTMYVKIPSSAGQITIPEDAAFKYNLAVQFIDYDAVWGMFEPSSDMSDNNVVTIADEWEGWNDLKSLRLPLADPKVNLNITTKIAGAMIVKDGYLYVIGDEGEKVDATFNGQEYFYKYFTPREYLPLDSEIGDSVTMTVIFDKDPARGHIDKLFNVHPEKIGYNYALDFNRQETAQIRIPEDAGIKLDAICTIPFIFNEGVSLSYSDTITDIDLDQLTLDSLLAEVEIIDTIEEATLKLALGIENSIPLQFTAILTCLDSLGNVLMDIENPTKPFQILGQDTLVIKAPTYQEDVSGNWIGTPVADTKVITITEDLLSVLSQVKSIVFDVALNDKSLQDAYRKGMLNIKLTDQQGLRIGIGIGADLKALLNFDSLMQSEESSNEAQL